MSAEETLQHIVRSRVSTTTAEIRTLVPLADREESRRLYNELRRLYKEIERKHGFTEKA